MTQEDDVVQRPGCGAAATAHAQEVYRRIRERTVAQLTAALAAALDHADDVLLEQAQSLADSGIRGVFYKAVRRLRWGRRELESAFRAALEADFDGFAAGTAGTVEHVDESDDELDLRLVDSDVLDDSIAVDGMVAKARTRTAALLADLEAGLSALFPDRVVDADSNPLDPGRITEAFVASAAALELAIVPRLCLYQLFDKQVLAALPAAYEQAGGLLAAARPRRAGVGARAAGGSYPRRQLSRRRMPAADRASGEQALSLLDVLCGLMADALPRTADVADLVAALSAMQRDTVAESDHQHGVKRRLGRFLSQWGGGYSRIGWLEDATIELVDMLFAAIRADPQLPAPIKALLSRLQIPLLKVALLDRSVLSGKHHPARLLIDEAARAALGWVEPAQVEHDPLYRQLDGIVERILREFDDQIGLFGDLLDDFLVFLQAERDRARLIEERTRRVAEGKSGIDRAQRRVGEEIGQRIATRQLPPVARRLLDAAWSKVLFLTYLKEGEEGVEWQRRLRVVERLVASMQPATAPGPERPAEIPALLQDLREGLNAILFDPAEMAALLEALEAEHARCLAAPTPCDRTPVEPPATAPAPAAHAPAEDGSELAVYLRQLRELPIGTWLELVQRDGSRIRASLSARVDDGWQLLLVNRAGFKIAEYELDELARDLRLDRVTVLDDGPLFDKALETVIARLRTGTPREK